MENMIPSAAPGNFSPKIGEVHLFRQPVILWLRSGQGLFEVDFQVYSHDAGRCFFLLPGQYFKVVSGDFSFAKIDFPALPAFRLEKFRYLFSHVVSLAHIDGSGGFQGELQAFFQNPSPAHLERLLDACLHQWMALNPFNAPSQELQAIFNLKDWLEDIYREPLNVCDMTLPGGVKHRELNALTCLRLHRTIHSLLQERLLLEARRELAFSTKNTKEIAAGLGYRDSAWFNRFFKNHTGKTPIEFRQSFEFEAIDNLLEAFFNLLENHFRSQHQVGFYAKNLHVSPDTLNRKLRRALNQSAGDLLRQRLFDESKRLLQLPLSVQEVAFELGFSESNHFSEFFKSRAGATPSQFRSQS